MTLDELWVPFLAVLFSAQLTAGGQGSTISSSQATAFIGTWAIEMIEPMTGIQTVKIWEKNGVVAASVGSGNSPAKEVAGIVNDGNMLVLTIGRDRPDPVLENGVPIWAVYALTLDRDTMKVALMLEQSRTVKRGIGKKLKD